MAAWSLPSPGSFLSPFYSGTAKQTRRERLQFVLRVPPAQKGATAKIGGGSSGHPSIRRDGVPSLPKDFPISWPQSPRQTGWHQCRSAEPKSFSPHRISFVSLCIHFCDVTHLSLAPSDVFYMHIHRLFFILPAFFFFRQFTCWGRETKFLS